MTLVSCFAFQNVTNLNLTGIETCYKVFKCGIYTKVIIEEDHFCFEPEITAKRRGCSRERN